MRKIKTSVFFILGTIALTPLTLRAQLSFPDLTIPTYKIKNNGGMWTICIRYDPFMTTPGVANQTVVSAFKIPEGLTINSVQLVPTCNGNSACSAAPPGPPISGFGLWAANGTTTGAVNGMMPAGAGAQWRGFSNVTTGVVAGGQPCDLLIDIAVPGNNENSAKALMQALCRFHSARLKEAFAGPGLANGTPTTGSGFTETTPSTLCPALTNWGVGMMVLLVCGAGGHIVIRRSRAIA